MQEFLVYFLIFCGAFSESSSGTSLDTIFDVTEFGAAGNGGTDDSKAFESAWTEACSKSSDNIKITVPSEMTFLVSPITFEGPCQSSSITFEILGTIVAQPREAWDDRSGDQWLYFHKVDGLSVVGNGQGLIDGNGQSWWEHDSSSSPTAMRFSHCNNLQITGLKHKDSQKNHVSINECNSVYVSNLHMTAPAKSPNTDGIDISSSKNLSILDSVIETGDDCIAINGGTSAVDISGITCGPGHGISIGSLGKDGQRDEVEGIRVNHSTFIRTDNGVRIKTWQGGSGFARNIIFSDINFIEANNPVIIDQYYCPHKQCINKASAVKVSDVRYTELRGTCLCKNATINLSCSETVPCTDIVLKNVDIQSADPHVSASAHCINAHGTAHAAYPVVSCLATNGGRPTALPQFFTNFICMISIFICVNVAKFCHA